MALIALDSRHLDKTTLKPHARVLLVLVSSVQRHHISVKKKTKLIFLSNVVTFGNILAFNAVTSRFTFYTIRLASFTQGCVSERFCTLI